MKEDEFKFLEVFYKRVTVNHQSYSNYLNGSLPHSVENKQEYIDALFNKFNELGYIHRAGTDQFQITVAGREKYEELNETKELSKKVDILSSKKSRLPHLGTRFWLAAIILMVIVSIITSFIINNWDHIRPLFNKIFNSNEGA